MKRYKKAIPTRGGGMLIKEAEKVVAKKEGRGRPTQSSELVALTDGIGLYFGSDGAGYVELTEENETWRVASKQFKNWLRRRYYDEHGKPPGKSAVDDAVELLEAEAEFNGEWRQVFVRVGEHEGSIYLDLCDDQGRVVEITAEGWEVVTTTPIIFRRNKTMGALPVPEEGEIEELRAFLNLETKEGDKDWTLIKGYLLGTLNPDIPYPLLALYGEQGSAKSTTSKLLKSIIDPSTAPLRSMPKQERDLMISASNGWLLAYDNISYLQDWISDAFCRLATGGGFSTRALYENDEETVFESRRPVMLNGITEMVTRSDLLDRAIVINLAAIPEDQRKTEREFWEKFKQSHAKILGALCEAVSRALRAEFELEYSPRMSDFALWAAKGFNESTAFVAAYTENEQEKTDMALDASVVARILLGIVSNGWSGTAQQLLEDLEAVASEKIRKTKLWPKNPRSLVSHLARIAPNLRRLGITMEKSRDSGERTITFVNTPNDANDADDGRSLSSTKENSIYKYIESPILPSRPSQPSLTTTPQFPLYGKPHDCTYKLINGTRRCMHCGEFPTNN